MQETYIQASTLSTIILIAGFMIIALACFLIIFFLLSRNKQNKLFLERLTMENDFQQQFLRSQLETQEYTFNQISQELHDNIGQLLSTTKLLMNITIMETSTPPDTLKTAEETIAKAINDLRLLSKSLSKEWLSQFNLVENLEAEKDRINAARNIHVLLHSEYGNLPIEPDAQVMLFRVAQEALQNSIKHARAKNIIINIKNIDGHFVLMIEDDGSGFNIEEAKLKSLGMQNMEHRVQLLKGRIEWISQQDSGTTITITIPKA